MLILGRKLGQRVRVGHDIRITLVRIDKHSVRIGIAAPDHVAVHREEVVRADREFHALVETELEEVS